MNAFQCVLFITNAMRDYLDNKVTKNIFVHDERVSLFVQMSSRPSRLLYMHILYIYLFRMARNQ